MIEKKQSDLHFSNPSLNSTEIPTLDTQTANQLLNNVFEACNMEPNSIPVEVLESWGNYKKPAFDFGKMISYPLADSSSAFIFPAKYRSKTYKC